VDISDALTESSVRKHSTQVNGFIWVLT
jgi:hypothetical protein